LSGNKYYKLQGYLNAARRSAINHLITMAGPRSNHLRAFAAMTRSAGLAATAIIRGDELADQKRHSPELRFARDLGVGCIFVSRDIYRRLRETTATAERENLLPEAGFSGALFIPEGGLGVPGLEGLRDWAAEATNFETIWLPCATGMTVAGFLAGTKAPTRIMGVAVLNNAAAIQKTIHLLVPDAAPRFDLISDYAATGFAKIPPGVANTAAEYSAKWGVTIDTIYLAKTVAALEHAAKRGELQGRTLLLYTYNE
jgi:1-aminocyclopropane-1-carboxylate deaminase